MKATTSANRPKHTVINLEEQAAALWNYVQVHAARFSMDAARDIVRRLNMQLGEDPKLFVKRLRPLLEAHRVKLKHMSALQACSHLANFSSWYKNEDDGVHRLTFSTFDIELARQSHYRCWDDLTVELRDWTDRLRTRGQLPLGILALRFTGNAIEFSTPVPPTKEDAQQINQTWPLATITPTQRDPDWYAGAPSAMEKLRRHLEEGGRAAFDGYEVLRLCSNSKDLPGHPTSVGPLDAVNSELVLIREDNADDPQSGYEIARGDEVACWFQLELALRKSENSELDALQVSIPKEGVGAWLIGDARYIWMVETLKPLAYIPGRITGQIGIDDCERLLRRYTLVKGIHGQRFKHHEQSKRIDYLSGMPEDYRVDLHFLLRMMDKRDLNWDSYIATFDAQPLSMSDKLPVGFVFQLLKDLEIDEPNKLLAKPNLSEMHCVEDVGLLRALMPRIDFIRYTAPRELDNERAQRLASAIEDFSGGLQVRRLLSAGAFEKEELPHLVWAYDADELRAAVEALGLTMYVAVIPHLQPINDLLPVIDGFEPWPWAAGNALFIRLVEDGSAQ